LFNFEVVPQVVSEMPEDLAKDSFYQLQAKQNEGILVERGDRDLVEDPGVIQSSINVRDDYFK